MAADLYFDIYPPDDPAGKISGTDVAARVATFSLDDNLVDGEYTAELFGPGSGWLEVHVDNPDAQYLVSRSYVLVRKGDFSDAGILNLGGFFLDHGTVRVLGSGEQLSRVIRWEGSGGASALDRYNLGHSVYATGQTLRGDRTIPGKWSWNDKPYGAMLVRVLEEGYDHPDAFYEFYDWDFSRALDSNGNAWSDIADYEVPIGTSGLKLWADFLRLGLVAEVTPDLTITAYRQLDEYRTDRTSATFAAGKVRFEAGVNIVADMVKQLNASSQRTHVLIEDRIGDYQTIDEDIDGNPIAGVPFMTYMKSTTTADDAAIEQMGKTHLTYRNQFVNVAKVRHLFGPGGASGAQGYDPAPLGDYWLGDLVTVHTGTTELDYDETTIEVAAVRYYVNGNTWMVETELGAQYRNFSQQAFQSQVAQTIVNQLQSIQLCEPTSIAEATPDAWIPGDILVVHAGHGVNSIPSLASGFTAIGSGGSQAAGPLGMRSGYRILVDGDLTAGTWGGGGGTGLTGMIFRGQHGTPIGDIGGDGGTGGTATFPALAVAGSNSWVLGFTHRTGGGLLIGIPPSGMVNRTAGSVGSVDRAGHDTDGIVASWSSTNAVNGTAGAWQTNVFELAAASAGSLRFVTAFNVANGGDLPAQGNEAVLVAGDGREELVGTSVKAKRCDDTEHWHEVGSGSPTVNDDVDAGFRVGTLWINDDGEVWYATDVDAGAATWIQFTAAGGVDLSAINFLVGTASGLLSAEIAVGTTPGGELGGTWASPTVDATHSGSTHSAATDTHIADASDAHDASAISFVPNGSIAATDVQAAIVEVRDEAAGGGAPSTADYLVGTADAGLSNEIAVGTTPGGELGGTWASPTVDATHSGSTHDAATNTHIADGTDAHDASAISIADSGGFYSSTEVEGALQEVGAAVGGAGASDDLKQRANIFIADYVTARYYDSAVTASAYTTVTLNTSTLTFVPLYVRKAVTVDRIAINVTANAAAGDNARLGIYETGSDGKPGALLLDAGAVSCATNGVKEVTISQALAADTLYWLAIVTDPTGGGFQQSSIALDAAPPTLGGLGSFATTHTGGGAWAVAHTYGALPNPAGTVVINASLTIPAIRVRAA